VTDQKPAAVAVALGSNLGDRDAHLRGAVSALAGLLTSIRISSFHDTAPVDVDPQPRFLNAAAVGLSALDPRRFLEALLAIEARYGRTRPKPGAPRTLDLDLILYGDLIVSEPGLQVPHPRFRERRFVLAPLAEIAPELRDPVTGATVQELLAGLPSS
jgi:2-amino-4-hydroxy-6-hydroxymethyldihydropteridine diphosphokinase